MLYARVFAWFRFRFLRSHRSLGTCAYNLTVISVEFLILDVQSLIVHQLPFIKDDNTEKKVPSACIYMHVKRQI